MEEKSFWHDAPTLYFRAFDSHCLYFLYLWLNVAKRNVGFVRIRKSQLRLLHLLFHSCTCPTLGILLGRNMIEMRER